MKRTTIRELVEHLGWPDDHVANTVSNLRSAGFLWSPTTSTVVIAEPGRRLLEVLRLGSAPQVISGPGLELPERAQVWLPAFSSAFPIGEGERQANYEMRLMTEAQSGSSEAFEALVRELWSFVYMRSRWTLKNAEDAQDATQASFFKAFMKLRDFNPHRSPPHPPNPVRAWFGAIANNTSTDILRRRVWEEPIDPEGAMSDPELDRLESHELDPEQLVILREHHGAVSRGVLEEHLPPLQRAFHDAWEQLGVTDRTVLGLRYWDNLSFPEIARELGKSEGQMRMRVFRSKEKLRRLMDEQLGRDE